MDLLKSLGLPRCALNMIQAFYDNNRCMVQTNGFCPGCFGMTACVRQGCPLSPLLYIVCADLLIERIRSQVPSAVIRTYADDTAVLMQNLAKIVEDLRNLRNCRTSA